ncbi:MAG: lysylphosphatidylglycerol synthase domain-containing protein [Bacteroidota bacterium]
MKTKVRKTYNYLIRFLIIIATYGFIYQQVFHRRDLAEIYHAFLSSFTSARFIYMTILLLLLMFFNWSVEAIKWKFLINKIERISWYSSIKAVFSGVALSSFTPNRVGDYFGRVFILEKANRIEGIFITILGSMSQLLVTFTVGTTSIYIMFVIYPETLLSYFRIPEHLYVYFLWGGALLIIGMNILITLLFLNISLLSSLANRIKGKMVSRLTSYIHVLSAYTLGELIAVILLSFLRFIIFSSQMYLLLRLFAVELPYFPAMIIIAVIFFVMTMIPTIAITELGIRGSVSLFVIGVYFGNPLDMPSYLSLGIVAASTALWIINLAIPALMGAIFVFSLKFFRKGSDD